MISMVTKRMVRVLLRVVLAAERGERFDPGLDWSRTCEALRKRGLVEAVPGEYDPAAGVIRNYCVPTEKGSDFVSMIRYTLAERK